MTYIPPLNGGRINANITGNVAAAGTLMSTGTVVLSGGNNITLSQNGQSIQIAAANGGGTNTIGMSTGGNTLGDNAPINGTAMRMIFAGGNNITLSQSTNASSATLSVVGLGQALSGSNGSFSFQTATFGNANGMSFLTNNGSMVGSYTVPTVTNSSWTVSDNATSATVGRLAFTQSNGITMSLSTSNNGQHTVIASHNGITSQSVQTQSRFNLTIGGNSTSAGAGYAQISSGTLTLAGGNNITLSQNGNVISVAGPAAGISNVNLSAGTTSNNLSNMVFSNSNGIGFGLNGSTITASHNALTNANLSAGTTSNNLSNVVFSNSNGVSFGLNGSTITASHNGVSNAITNVNMSAGTTSNNLSNMVFSNSNGVSFGLNGSTVTASHNAITSQTNQTMGVFAASNTTQSTSATVDARQMTFAGAGVASVGATNGSVVISVPSGGGGLTNVNLSAGTTSNNLSNAVFSNSNGIGFGLNGSTITASHNIGLYMYSTNNTIGQSSSTTLNANSLNFSGLGALSAGFSGSTMQLSVPQTSSLSATGAISISTNASTISIGAPAFSAGMSNLGNTTGTSGTVSNQIVFAGGNNITLSQSTAAGGNTITISGGEGTVSNWEPMVLQHGNLMVRAQSNASIYFYKLQPQAWVSASQMMMLASISVSSSSNSSHAGVISLAAGIFTATGSTLSLITQSSGSAAYQWTNTSSNSINSLTGMKGLSIPMNVNMSPGNYWIGMWARSSNTNANWFSSSLVMFTGVNSSFNNLLLQASNSTAGVQEGVGMYSASSSALPTNIAMSLISQNNVSLNAMPYIVFKNRTF